MKEPFTLSNCLSLSLLFVYLLVLLPEVFKTKRSSTEKYLGPSWAYVMERFPEIVNGEKPLAIFPKSSITEVRQGPNTHLL